MPILYEAFVEGGGSIPFPVNLTRLTKENVMKEKSGMKSPTMPKGEFSRSEGKLGNTSNLKYGSEMGNPKELDKNNEGLANYVKKNKMKY